MMLEQENSNSELKDVKMISQSKEDYLRKKEDIKRIEKKKRDLKKLEEKIMQLEEDIKVQEQLLYSENNDINVNSEYEKHVKLKEELNHRYKELDELYEDDEIIEYSNN